MARELGYEGVEALEKAHRDVVEGRDEGELGLGGEWPRNCGCGRSFDEHEWRTLLFLGTMVDAEDSFDLRRCVCCNSTISQKIETT